ncbi:6449_t:CDS:2 [Funneliformis geosporum]|uniref:6449_t:CDS:1 n=1 Tax=Funneliformis geosporum TaxID=1117311 RepID=A0A9W4SC70_9GLOM|nr:6449_t:CDS:2 [Funneliformis geosporum]
MQYANDGDLQNYLEKNFKILTWNDKKKLAFQIAEGLNYLHNENILHRDLHSKNIVIHNGNAKITDFGLSKNMNLQNSTIHIGTFGRIAYIDPKKLLDLKFKYEKASDIYSYGVLMWEISSGIPPFKELISKGDQALLRLFIIDGYRENVIEETPEDYKMLYEKCWNSLPGNRPSIKKLSNTLFARMENGKFILEASKKSFKVENFRPTVETS